MLLKNFVIVILIFTKADKGNITVALDKACYIKKMKDLLNDPNT